MKSILRTSRIICRVFLLGITFVVPGQDNNGENQSAAYLYAMEMYDNAISNQKLLFNGSRYIPMSGNLRGHPYYHEDIIENGTIHFDDMIFTNVVMRYDIVNDQLIVNHRDHQGKTALVKLYREKVNRFVINDLEFVFIEDSKYEKLKAGFYANCYKGQSKLYKKIFKEIQEELNQGKAIVHFSEKERFYVVVRNEVYRAGSKGSIMKIFSDKKTEIKSFIQEKKLRFKADKENDLIITLQYYDQISY